MLKDYKNGNLNFSIWSSTSIPETWIDFEELIQELQTSCMLRVEDWIGPMSRISRTYKFLVGEELEGVEKLFSIENNFFEDWRLKTDDESLYKE